ncbi:MAG: DUF4280 domain-containing protein [Acetatifactor sp.]|nr:DUF4280 domain-containing protein [Acetatifactor sp.]
MSEQTNSNIEEEEFSEEEKMLYAQRLMRIKCSCGTKSNYINIPIDHGVVTGSDQQPLLNANDHIGGTGNNIIHFGKCRSDHNPHRVFLRTLSCNFEWGRDLLEDWGIVSLDCTPVVEQVWQNTNDKNMLDGAPALLVGSCATCRYGGTITFTKSEAEEVVKEDNEEDKEEDIVKKETDEVVAAAMEKIRSTGEGGDQAVLEAQMYLLQAAAQSPEELEGVKTFLQGYMAMQRAERLVLEREQAMSNYEYNVTLSHAQNYILENGLITNQQALGDFRVNYFNASQVGCGAVAAYNANLILQLESYNPLEELIYEMEPYGLINNPYGLMPAGLIDYYVRGDMQVSYEVTDLAAHIEESDAGIIMYVAQDHVHYVTCKHNDDGSFSFYNTYNGVETQTMQFEEFEASLEEENPIAIAAITLTQKENH